MSEIKDDRWVAPLEDDGSGVLVGVYLNTEVRLVPTENGGYEVWAADCLSHWDNATDLEDAKEKVARLSEQDAQSPVAVPFVWEDPECDPNAAIRQLQEFITMLRLRIAALEVRR